MTTTTRLQTCVWGVVYMQVFTTRGLEQMSANADSLRQQVEEFKALVPLVQVRAAPLCKLAFQVSIPCMPAFMSN
jgi:hypothetical protein